MTTQTPEQFLGLTNDGKRSAKFAQFGDFVDGIVTETPTVRQQLDFNTKEPKFYNSGNPIMQMIIYLQTETREDDDDDGIRIYYVDSKNKRETLRDAVGAAGATEVEVGARIRVEFLAGGTRSGEAKEYKSQYWRPDVLGVNTATGEVGAVPYAQSVAPMTPKHQREANPPPTAKQHTPEVLAALKAAGIDPATIPVQ